MKVAEVAFTCYPASDLAASRAFYEGLMGLTAAIETPMGDDGSWVEYEIGRGCPCAADAKADQPAP